MKMNELITQLSVAFFVVLSAQAQGTFQNLDFEQADPMSSGDPLNPDAVTAAQFLACGRP